MQNDVYGISDEKVLKCIATENQPIENLKIPLFYIRLMRKI